MILCGASACPRTIVFARFRAIADEVDAILMVDIAHISGLVATKQHPSPFEHCDVVTATTHDRSPGCAVAGGEHTPEFVEDSKAVVSNAGTLAEALIAKGHKLASGRTDIHLVLWVLRPHGLTGSKVEKLCEAASISLNRNTVPGDASALSPGGVRIGAPAMTRDSLVMAALGDCSLAINPKVQHRPMRGLVRGSFPAPHHHDPNEMLPNFAFWVMVAAR